MHICALLPDIIIISTSGLCPVCCIWHMFAECPHSAGMQVASLPQSHVWTCLDWEAAKAAKPDLNSMPDPRRSATPEPTATANKANQLALTAADQLEASSPNDRALAVVKCEEGEGKSGSVARELAGLRRREGGGLTLKERLQQCEATEDERITFGKVCDPASII